MALKKKIVPLSIAQSANQKGDPKSLAPGTPTKVVNAQFSKANRLDKRFGYDSLNVKEPLTYYSSDYPGPPPQAMNTDERITLIATGGASLRVYMDVVFDNTDDRGSVNGEWNNGITAGFSLGIVDANGDLWVFDDLNDQLFFSSFNISNYFIIRFELRATGGTDYITVQKNGSPSTIDDLLGFGNYTVNNIAVYDANNPSPSIFFSGWVKHYENVGGEFKGLVGTEDHLLLLAGDKVFSYSETLDNFAEIGDYRPAELTIDSIDETGQPLMSADSVHADGITYYAYLQFFTATDAFMSVTAVDEATGERVFGPISIDSGDISVLRLILFKGVPYVFYSSIASVGSAGPIKGRSLSPDGLGTEVSLVLDMYQMVNFSGGNHWDIINYNDERMVLVYPVSIAIRSTKYFDADLTSPGSPTTVNTTLNLDDQDQTSISVSSSGDRFFIFCSQGPHTDIEYFIVDDSGTVTTDPEIMILSVGGGQADSGGLCVISNPENLGGVDGARCYYNPNSTTYGNSGDGFGKGTIRWHVANDGTITISSDDKLGHGFEVISGGWLNDGKWYYLLYRSAIDDTCYYIGSWEGDNLIITAQLLYGRVPDGFSQYRPVQFNTHFIEISPGVARVAVISKDLATAVPGIVSIKVDFNSRDKYSAVPYGRSMILAGTNLHAFCGQYLRELNFFHTSREPKLTQLSSGGYIPEGVYKVVLVYEFTDRNGYLHRSNPSPPATVTTVAGEDNLIQCKVESYVVTNLTGEGGLVALIPYRTVANGSTFHRDEYYEKTENGTEPANPTNQKNSAFLDARTITMKRSDEELETQAFLFTDSKEVPSTPIPPVKYLTTWGSRIWAGGSARDEAIYFSKINQTNLMPEFSEFFSISIQDKPGRTTGLVGLTDKIILSKRGRLFYSYGAGPDRIGEGGDFALFEEIPGVGGAVNGKSMVVNGAGVSYKSDKGIYTLSPGLLTQFSGASYEDEANEDILRAITPIDSETVRYVTASGVLSLDTFFNTWSKDSSFTLEPVDACLYANKFHVLTPSSVLVENRSSWVDAGSSYDMSIETGWISLATVVGFQRFYRMFMVMDNLSPYTVTVSLAYDYGPYVDFTTFNDVADSRIIIYPSKQKCEAFRLKIEVSPNGGTEQSLNINFIGLVVGTKQGLPKQLPVSQRIGVTTI